MIDKNREKIIAKLARDALIFIDPNDPDSIELLDDFLDSIAKKTEIDNTKLREELKKMLSKASKNDKDKLNGAMHFVDATISLSLSHNQPSQPGPGPAGVSNLNLKTNLPPSAKGPKGWIIAFSVVAVVAIVFVAIAINLWSSHPAKTAETTAAETTVSETAAETTAEITEVDKVVEKAVKIMENAGWNADDYVIGSAIDLSKDKSTGAAGAFTKKGLKTVQEMLNFVKSDTASSKVLVSQIIKQTGATVAEVMDEGNWVVVQSVVKFSYPGNTIYKNGKAVKAGSIRKGSIGDIFFIFISPSSGKYIFVRGGCANPQTVPPKTTPPVTTTETSPPETTPETTPPTTPPTTLEEKDPSQDPAPQGNAPVGGGTNQDPGPGKYIPPESMEQPPSTPYVAPVAPNAS